VIFYDNLLKLWPGQAASVSRNVMAVVQDMEGHSGFVPVEPMGGNVNNDSSDELRKYFARWYHDALPS
jgi:hypothetical protein